MAQAVGFFTDTTVCIGCKACEVACHQWNALPARQGGNVPLSGQSYDNTVSLSDVDWRHVKFIEQFSPDRSQGRWLMMSDVCKHCVDAPCLEVCPTGSIIRTEFDTVYIQEPVCNGCRDCITACPFGVIHVSAEKHIAQKCTFCYDRLKDGLVPACAQACPTASIQFGPIEELQDRAAKRVEQLHGLGANEAYLYGADTKVLGGLNAFYLLMDKPEVYGLPAEVVPIVPSTNLWPSSLKGIGASLAMVFGAFLAFGRRKDAVAAAEGTTPEPKPEG
jgi:formate dehydrogenase iron-sulfur subunit